MAWRAEGNLIPAYRQLFHNYIRPRKALDHKTSARVARIGVKVGSKSLALIQNACK
jgi:hypothetical protein